MSLKRTTCSTCHGHGVVSDYGDGRDFYGPKSCPTCGGSGEEPARDARGRFIKEEDA